jgi:serralysin
MPSIAPLGNEFLVNSVTADGQITPVVTALADGKYIVVWVGAVLPGAFGNTSYAGADIRAQVFNADGSRAGVEFVVNPVTAGVQFAPTVTLLSDNNFLIAWQDGIGSLTNPASTPSATINAREFALDADGRAIPVSAAFQIGAGAEAMLPAITAVAGGGFFAAWQQGRAGALVGQAFDSSNTAIGSAVTIDNTQLIVANPRIATLVDGNVVVAWTNLPGGGQPSFSVQVLTPGGVATGPQTGIVFGTPSIAAIGDLVALASGGFALSHLTNFNAQNSVTEVSLFFPDGTLGTTSFVATGPLASLSVAQLAALPNGGLAAAWANLGTGQDVFVQAFNPIGDPVGVASAVNQTLAGNQTLPSVTALSNGDLIIVWRDDSATGGDTSGTAIRGRFVDYIGENAPPVASFANLLIPQLEPGTTIFDESTLTDFATDSDGDTLRVTAITNVTNGTAVLLAGGEIQTTTTPGATDAVSFDYTVSDGNGGTSTARARVVTPTDFITLRGSSAVALDFRANDYLQPRANGYGFTESSDFLQLTVLNGRTQFLVNPFGNNLGYYDLLVGQTQQAFATYNVTNPVTSAIDYTANVVITLQGWAQIGGTGRDSLAGTALADSLQGGTGVANELVGGAGDDTYTSRAAGDSIIEFAGGGTDTVRTDLSVFVLSANVENLFQIGNPLTFVGVGNAENNIIQGLSAGSGSVLAGLGGNDTLTMSSSSTAELVGGTGDDIYVFSNPGTSVVEFAGEGIDTVRINNNYTLPANVENLTYTGNSRFDGTGNALDNVITGGTISGELVGLGGNDTYVVRNVGDSIVEAAGGGTDTVQTALSFYRLNAANVENLTYTGTGSFTGIGNAGDNVITGGARADFLFAGAGIDTLVGGAGADLFFFDAAVNGVDAVADFTSGSDRLAFNQSVFAHTPTFALVQGAGAQVATSTNSTFLYDSTTGLLSYDADGNGAGAAIAIATLSPSLSLALTDFVFYG